MGRISSFGQHLYTGRVSFDFVGRRRLWYTISAIIVVFAASGLLVKGINEGVEFRGGVEFVAQISPTSDNVDAMRNAVADSGVSAGDPVVTTSGDNAIRIQVEPLTQPEAFDRLASEVAALARRSSTSRADRQSSAVAWAPSMGWP